MPAGADGVVDAIAFAQARGVARIEVIANAHAAAFYDQLGFVHLTDDAYAAKKAALQKPFVTTPSAAGALTRVGDQRPALHGSGTTAGFMLARRPRLR